MPHRQSCRPWVAGLAVLTLAGIMRSVPIPVSDAQTSGGFSVHGTVTDVAGHAVAGAYVYSGSFETRADRTGRYSLQVAPRASLYVSAWAPGCNQMPVILTSRDGNPLRGDAVMNFSGNFALTNAFLNPAYGASLHGLPVRVTNSRRVLHLHGTSQVRLESRLAVILPDGNVKSFRLRQRGSHFDATVHLPSNGTYWIEINATSGFAVFNVLVFRGEAPHPPLDPSFPPEPSLLQVKPAQLADYALYIINNVRQTLGRKVLVVDPQLRGAARAHTVDMGQNGFYGLHPHIGSNGSTPEQRIAAAGVRARATGEVVGRGYTVGAIVTSFLESAAHRGTLLGRYHSVGIAVRKSAGELLMTVDLAR